MTVERILPGTQVASVPFRPAPPPSTAPTVKAIPSPPPILVQPIATATTPISAEKGGVFIQLGAFSTTENADSFRDKMKRNLDWMREPIAVAFRDGLHRVRIGPLANRDEAQAIADKVRTTMNISPVVTRP